MVHKAKHGNEEQVGESFESFRGQDPAGRPLFRCRFDDAPSGGSERAEPQHREPALSCPEGTHTGLVCIGSCILDGAIGEVLAGAPRTIAFEHPSLEPHVRVGVALVPQLNRGSCPRPPLHQTFDARRDLLGAPVQGEKLGAGHADVDVLVTPGGPRPRHSDRSLSIDGSFRNCIRRRGPFP